MDLLINRPVSFLTACLTTSLLLFIGLSLLSCEDDEPAVVSSPIEFSVSVIEGGRLMDASKNSGFISLERSAPYLLLEYVVDISNGYQSFQFQGRYGAFIDPDYDMNKDSTRINVRFQIPLGHNWVHDVLFTVTDKSNQSATYKLDAEFPVDLSENQIAEGAWMPTYFNANCYTCSMVPVSDGLLVVAGNVYKGTRTNTGYSWSMVLDSYWISDILPHPNGNIYISRYQSRLFYVSVDDGETWTESELTIPDNFEVGINKMEIDEKGNFYITPDDGYGTYPEIEGLFRSSDGEIWENITEQLGPNLFRNIMIISSEIIFVQDYDNALFRTQDAGETWETISSPGSNIFDWTLGKDGKLYISADQIYVSNDLGDSWTAMSSGFPSNALLSNNIFEAADGTLYASPNHYGVFMYEKDQGEWKSVGTDIAHLNVVNIAEWEGKIVAAVPDETIYVLE